MNNKSAGNEETVVFFLGLLITGLLVYFFVSILLSSGIHRETKTETRHMSQQIEQAINVAGLENKFIYVERGLFSSAAAGGLGAPQVFVRSARQFAELVPTEEPIYSSIEHVKYKDGTDNPFTLKRIYWAFIENRAGLMVYDEIYTCGRGESIKSYNIDAMTFVCQNTSYSVGFHFHFAGF